MVSTLPRNAGFTSPVILICCSTGAKTTFLASLYWACLTVTSSPMDVPEFFLMYPSIRIIPKPISDCEDATRVAVNFFPSISMSPSNRSSFCMHAGSILAIDLPTSACEKASATFNFISLFSI